MDTKKKALVSMGILLAAILLIILSIGGKFYMDQKQFHNEMVKVVKSEEAREVFESTLKKIDSHALTQEGKIKSYEIDYDSIEHSPMGSILVNLIINHDTTLVAKYDLNKRSGDLKCGGVDLSENLSELKREIQND